MQLRIRRKHFKSLRLLVPSLKIHQSARNFWLELRLP